MERNIRILILEDDDNAINAFQEFIKKSTNMSIIFKTKSSNEALNILRKHLPDVIILDLELHNGSGSGFDFLSNLNNIYLNHKPLIMVTTNIASNTVYNTLHKNFVDLIFYKRQPDYSPKLVLDSINLLLQNPNSNQNHVSSKSTDTNIPIELRNKINKELDLIGISYKHKGREYLVEGIYYLLTEPNSDITVFQYLSNKYKLLTTSISRAIQTSINHTWRTSAIEDLKTLYTAQINYYTGVPTPTEFMYFIVDKLKY